MLDTFEKEISRQNIAAFSDYIINIGKIDSFTDHYRVKNNFAIFKAGEEGYRYTNSADCKQLDCIFASIFILSSNGNLIKISVSPTEPMEYVQYIIYKDIQKVLIVKGFVVEVHLHKHFDSEKIVCDSPEIAFKIYSKVNQFREGRRNFERR